MLFIVDGWPASPQPLPPRPGSSYVTEMGPAGHVQFDFTLQPHVHVPPLGPSTTLEGVELPKHEALGFPPTKPTSVHPVGTT